MKCCANEKLVKIMEMGEERLMDEIDIVKIVNKLKCETGKETINVDEGLVEESSFARDSASCGIDDVQLESESEGKPKVEVIEDSGIK